MKTVGDRIKYYIEYQGDSVLSFAQKNSINYSGLTQIINNKRTLGMEVLQQLKTAMPNIDTEWLLFGTERSQDTTPTISKIDEPFSKYATDPGKEMLMKYLDDPEIINKIYQHLTNKTK